jgi:hypothetical protein
MQRFESCRPSQPVHSRNEIGRSCKSFLGLLVDEMRLAQIELPLDPAPRLVLQLAAPKEIVDLLPLGGDQLKFDLIVKL